MIIGLKLFQGITEQSLNTVKSVCMRAVVFFLFTCSMGSCNDDGGSVTHLLTSKTWGKPVVLYSPPSGFYTITSCLESYNFRASGSYAFINYCNPTKVINGNWSWIKVGQEIKLETSFNGILQKTFRIIILELTSGLLHVRQIEITEPLDSVNYWELQYKPK